MGWIFILLLADDCTNCKNGRAQKFKATSGVLCLCIYLCAITVQTLKVMSNPNGQPLSPTEITILKNVLDTSLRAQGSLKLQNW